MRKSYDGLFSLVRDKGIFKGDMFLFLSRDRTRAKVLFWDGTGLNIWMKRLENGLFADVLSRDKLTESELKLFIEGSKAIIKQMSPEDLTHRFSA